MKHSVFLACLSLVLFGVSELKAENPFRLSRTSTSVKSHDINMTYVSDSVLLIPQFDEAVSGVSVDGTIVKDSPDYLVRIILIDKNGGEHLLMESYEEVNSSTSFSFTDYCEETALLENIHPDRVKIIVKYATLHLDRLNIAPQQRDLDKAEFKERQATLRKARVNSRIERINIYNKTHNRLWAAGETELASQDYQTRRRMLGLPDEVNSCGIEYYVGGIFEFGHQTERQRINLNSPYVDKFDWRDRHGKNWITSVKNQVASSFCVVFAALGSLEAVSNLYYNRKMDLNLSEREIIDCADTVPHHLYTNFEDSIVYNYLTNHGVCDEEVYPVDSLWFEQDTLFCKSDIITPNEQIRINGYSEIFANPNTIKSNLISKGPLSSGWVVPYNSTKRGHAMVLVGYNTIKANDTIWYYNSNLNIPVCIGVINEHDPRIGVTYWIFKDSYGTSNTYYNLIFSQYPSNTETYIASMSPPISINLPLTAQTLNNDSIIWEDADGDGYYYWGLGSKPYSCPSWIPDIPDGDDSDPTKGPMDEYGYFYEIEGHGDMIVSGQSSSYGSEMLYGGIYIRNNGTLNLYGFRTLVGENKIVIEQNGTLIVNGGVLANAEFVFTPPCTIKVKNGGAIYMKNNCDFEPPVGCFVEIEKGIIGNMNKINWHTYQQNPNFY